MVALAWLHIHTPAPVVPTGNDGLSEPPSTNLSTPEPDTCGDPPVRGGASPPGAEGGATAGPAVAVNSSTEVEDPPAPVEAPQQPKVQRRCTGC
jgi:hypothetical protein